VAPGELGIRAAEKEQRVAGSREVGRDAGVGVEAISGTDNPAQSLSKGNL
jgi:hypothetical protein